MSGVAEAATLVGLVTGIIALLKTANDAYEAAQSASGIPKEFRAVAESIPLVQVALDEAQSNLKSQSYDQATLDAVAPVLQQCNENADALQKIFADTLPSKDASRTERYRKIIAMKAKSSKVKELMAKLLSSFDILEKHQIFQDANTLRDIKDQLEELKTMPEDAGDKVTVIHQGTGDINSVTGSGTLSKVAGNQYTYHGPTYVGAYPPDTPVFKIYTPRTPDTPNLPDNDRDYRIASPLKPKLVTPESSRTVQATKSKFEVPYQASDFGTKFGCFVERKGLLDNMRKTLLAESEDPYRSRRRILALHGPPGAGKSQLCNAFARQYGTTFTACFKVYGAAFKDLHRGIARLQERIADCEPDQLLDFSSLTDAGTLQKANRTLDGPREEAAFQDATQWLNMAGNENWLLVVEDVDPVDLSHGDLLGGIQQGTFILTTRHADIADFIRNLELLKVASFTAAESLELMNQTLGADHNHDQEGLKKLCESIEHHPQAVDYAANYMKWNPNFGPLEFVRQWKHFKNNTKLLMEQNDITGERNLYATFELAFNKLNAHARAFLSLCSHFSDKDIPLQAIQRPQIRKQLWTTDLELQVAISSLRRLSLFVDPPKHNTSTQDGGLSIHPVLHTIVRKIAQTLTSTERDRYFNTALLAIGSTIPQRHNPTYSETLEKLRQHAYQCRNDWIHLELTVYEENLIQIANVGRLLQDLGDTIAAAELLDAVLEKYDQLAQHSAVRAMERLSIRNNRGLLYSEMRDFPMARLCFERVLKELPSKNYSTSERSLLIVTLQNVGLVYNAIREYALARDSFKHALRLCEVAQDDEDVRVLTYRLKQYIGMTDCEQAGYKDAEKVVKEVLQDFKSLFPKYSSSLQENLYIIFAHQDLASIYRRQCDLRRAEDHLLNARKGLQAICKRGSRLLLDIEWEEVLLMEQKYRSQSGMNVDIEACFATLITEQTTLLGRNDPMTLRSIWVCGDVLRWAGEFDKAEMLLSEAVRGYDRLDNKDLIEAYSAKAALGKLLAAKGEYEEALEYFCQAREYFGALTDAKSKTEQVPDLDIRIAQVRTKYGSVQEAKEALERMRRNEISSEERKWVIDKLKQMSHGT